MPPDITFITTCKGRLEHLRQTLPSLAGQANSECILVDFDCPEQSHLWAARNFPAVRVIRVTNAPIFHLGHARNMGAASAAGQWLCFVDADIVLSPDVSRVVLPMLQATRYYRPAPLPVGAWGTVICNRDDFTRIEGYDEALEGWGGHDDDLYARLHSVGCHRASFPAKLLTPLSHEDDARTEHYTVKDRWHNRRINSFYLHVKYDLTRQLGVQAISLPVRQNIYREIRNTFLASIPADSGATLFEINLPDQVEVPIQAGWNIKRKWIYEMLRQSESPPPPSTKKAIDTYFARHAVRKLHIGCGDHLLAGWLNTDLKPRLPDVLPLDATRSLPFPDDSIEYIFSEHVLEHMSFSQGCSLLAECRRVLKPGGVLRIATPDLAFLVDLYRPDKSALQLAYLNWSKAHFLPWAPTSDDTFVINNAVRDWGHQFIYDDKILRRTLAGAGYGSIMRRQIMESGIAALSRLENEARMPPGMLALETIVFEATKS